MRGATVRRRRGDRLLGWYVGAVLKLDVSTNAVMYPKMLAARANPVISGGMFYERPRSRFVSDFIGVSNFLAGRVVAGGAATLTVELDGEADPVRIDAAAVDGFRPGDRVEVAIRPEKIRLAPGSGPAGTATGRIENVVHLGAVTYYYLRISGEQRLTVMEQNAAAQRPAGAGEVGQAVHAAWEAASALVLRPV